MPLTMSRERRTERPSVRLLTVVANATAAFPLVLLTALYGQWLLSWLLLGNRPVPSIDDPKYIVGASWMSFVTGIALVGFVPVGCVALVLNALHAVVQRPQPQPQQLLRVVVTVALWFATLVLLRSDPGRVVEWWFD